MPSFKGKVWNNFRFSLVPNENDFFRTFIRWIPYFWDSDIVMDLIAEHKTGLFGIFSRKKYTKETFSYKWELCDMNNNQISSNSGSFSILPLEHKADSSRKTGIINLGVLNINRYKVYLTVTNEKGESSPRMFLASFSIKDREDYLNTYLLSGGIALVVSLIVTLLGRC
jgi:hypothetical protein